MGILKMSSKGYTFNVKLTAHGFVGTCLEFPTLRIVERSRADALAAIQRLTETTKAGRNIRNGRVPLAISDRTYSGEISLRIPPELHKKLVFLSKERRTTLNRLISGLLEEAFE
jgi:predicted HicB family RNase H-like nuclease